MTQYLTERKLRVTEAMLQAVAGPVHVPAMLESMAGLLGADIAALTIGRPGRAHRRLVSVDRRDPTIARAPQPVQPHQYLGPLRDAALLRPAGRLYRGVDLFGNTHAHQSDYLRNWFELSPLSSGCAGYLHVADGEVCQLAFGRFREGAAELHFHAEEVDALESLLPHLQTLFTAKRQSMLLEALCASFVDRYERYHVGVAVLDQDGCLLFRNGPVQRLLDLQDGVRMQGSRLELADPDEYSALMHAIREHLASRGPDGGFAPRLFTVSRRDARDLALAIGCWGTRGDPASALTVLLFYDAERPALDRRDAMRVVYGLSDRESDLLAALAEGETIEEFARRSDCTLDAARSSLKRVFRKTGTSRQAEVVKLMLSGPAAMVR